MTTPIAYARQNAVAKILAANPDETWQRLTTHVVSPCFDKPEEAKKYLLDALAILTQHVRQTSPAQIKRIMDAAILPPD